MPPWRGFQRVHFANILFTRPRFPSLPLSQNETRASSVFSTDRCQDLRTPNRGMRFPIAPNACIGKAREDLKRKGLRMRRSLKLSLLVPALICMSAGASSFKPSCHNKDKGKEPEKARGADKIVPIVEGGSSMASGTPVTSGSTVVVNPGAPVAVLPGAAPVKSDDNGSDGVDNGSDGKVAAMKSADAKLSKKAKRDLKRAELAKKIAARLGKYKSQTLKKKAAVMSIDAMIAANAKKIQQPVEQTAFADTTRAPASAVAPASTVVTSTAAQ